ncbi:MAG: TlpA family protein disulfide reductase [Anaerolineae bacterium]|nr:TlpA family protein disulfide reductase [Anaerolineae bacterium]
MRLKILLSGLALALLLLAGLLLAAAGLPERARYTGVYIAGVGLAAPEPGYSAPLFQLDQVQGEPVALLALRGQPVLLNFWATWCAPCLAEMPLLQTLYDDYENLHILAINMGEAPAVVAQWAQQQRLTYPLLLDPARRLERLYALRGQPSTFVIAPDGFISAVFYGAVTEDRLRAALLPFVKERARHD